MARIIWQIFYGPPPLNLQIDHLDGNSSNNRINNLLMKTPANNSRNQSKSKNNTSGTTGVYLIRNKYWAAKWLEDGKAYWKFFSIATYGSDKAKQLAIDYRQSQINRLRDLGYDYTERHGT